MVTPWLKNNRKRLFIIGKIGILLLIPVAIFLISLNLLSAAPDVCLVKKVIGHSCPGCGMTRSIVSFFHGNFKDAFFYNKLIVIVLPLLAFLWIRELFRLFKRLSD